MSLPFLSEWPWRNLAAKEVILDVMDAVQHVQNVSFRFLREHCILDPHDWGPILT